jgi:ABC-type multidrug transport system fused ATPase/permease subunit
VVSGSLQWVRHADDVAFLADGRVRATGTHASLLATEPAYRQFVLRDEPVDHDRARGASRGR